MYDVFTHRSLLTSALGLLKKKERKKKKMMKNFAWAAIMHFRFSGASQAYFGSLKATNADTTVENTYTVKSAV